ncbi:LysR family transcriptional regulator [Streptacidiphilus jiangxiensis]|uniref:DNA-binding transcriptional regulator, LysR family n=1 Tax=Streptacidiphilus jiangxiensis TaxID=235985 RepID=A0A1H7P7W9_STRJI|nr:LysR family transcriptional regulator [Streptacidiphilus jiangxiensis]SEL31345.1 DNA-binding transcriptional regulator, LysR family [Streptacidiphilus jiangxiensis]
MESVDLNLLAPLHALLEERHVSRAAERLHMSQPSMSRALQRLRATLGDELLVRGPGGYQLTPRAERIQAELQQALPRLEHVFSGEAFDPATAARAFRLAGTDYTVSVLSGALLGRVFEQSPGSTVLFSRWHHAVFADAEHGLVDLLVHGGTPPPPLRTRTLFEEGYSCLMSAHHPLARRPALSLQDYLDCAHVVVDVTDGRQGHVDQRLSSLGVPRRASVTVPYHAAAAAAVPGTSLVATLPTNFAVHHSLPGTTTVVPAPEEIGSLRYAMSWHPRLDGDAAHQWLRDTIVATLGAG